MNLWLCVCVSAFVSTCVLVCRYRDRDVHLFGRLHLLPISCLEEDSGSWEIRWSTLEETVCTSISQTLPCSTLHTNWPSISQSLTSSPQAKAYSHCTHPNQAHVWALWRFTCPVLFFPVLCCIPCSVDLEGNHCAWIKMAGNVPKSHTLKTYSLGLKALYCVCRKLGSSTTIVYCPSANEACNTFGTHCSANNFLLHFLEIEVIPGTPPFFVIRMWLPTNQLPPQ